VEISPLPVLMVNINTPLLIVMVILVVLSGFFSMCETVFSSCNMVRLSLEAEEGKKGAQKALAICDNFDRAITTILVGNNIVNIALATIAVVFFSDLLANNDGSVEVISTAVTTVVVLLFGEITPKTIGKANADYLASRLSYLLYFFEIILFPLTIVFGSFQKLIHKKEDSSDKEPQVNEAELEAILDTMEDEGAIEAEEVEAIKNVLDLNDREVKDIMTPRPEMIAISDETDIEDIKKIFFESKFSRIPVFHEDKDHVIGILFEREFLTTYIKRKSFRIKPLLHEPIYVSATMKVDDLIHELQGKKMHMAMVSGEYGEVIGVVTMEDALEELVGEIYDEHDEIEDDVLINKIADNEYELNAEVYLDDLFEELELGNPPESQYSKLSGWLFAECEDIPEEGFNFVYHTKFIQKNDEEDYEEIYKKLTFVVSKVEDRRITEVHLFIEDEEQEDTQEEK